MTALSQRSSSHRLARAFFIGAASLWWLCGLSFAWGGSDPLAVWVVGNAVFLVGALYRWGLPDRAEPAVTGNIDLFNAENKGAAGLLKGPKARR